MTKEDYEVIADCSEVVRSYQEKIIELSNVELESEKTKKEINVKIGQMKDPLGSDFVEFQTELNTKNSQFHELVERKTKLVDDLRKLRESEKEMMEGINKLPNRDAIMAKVMADAGIELNG